MLGRRAAFEFGQEADGTDPFANAPRGDSSLPDHVEAHKVAEWADAEPVAFEATAALGKAQLTLDELEADARSRSGWLDAAAAPLAGMATALLVGLGRGRRAGGVVVVLAGVVALASGLVALHRDEGSGDGLESKRRDVTPGPRPVSPRVPDRPYERPRPRRRRRPRPARPPAPPARPPVPAAPVVAPSRTPGVAAPTASVAAGQEFGFER